MNGFEVVVDNSTPGENGAVAIYKGVPVSAETGSGNLLYSPITAKPRSGESLGTLANKCCVPSRTSLSLAH
jgi:hypothetical protein